MSWTRYNVRLAIAGTALTAAEAAACSTARNDITFGNPPTRVYATMDVRQGDSCVEPLNRTSKSSGDLGIDDSAVFYDFSSITIATRAKNGIAGAAGRSSFAYRPKPGFVGRDTFVVRVVGANNWSRGAAELAVTVNVRP